MIRLKTAKDIAGIYRSGQIAGRFLQEVASRAVPGVSTAEIDQFASEFIAKHNASPAFLGYRGYPGNVCVSLNEEIVHGIRSARRLADGDIVSVDVGVMLDGYISDTARTYYVGAGEMPADVKRLLEGTEKSLRAGLEKVSQGTPLRSMSRSIERVLEEHGLSVVRELTGHGVGFKLHEEPTVYNFDNGFSRYKFENGLVLAVEPMATLGSEEILLGSDNWTYRTVDASLSAHFEHTVACWDGRGWF